MPETNSDSRSAAITVEPVDGKRALKTFMRLPWRLYTDDPNWVPPLLFDLRARLTPGRHPYFEHAEAKYWIAYRDGVPVGRISAQIDQLVLQYQGPGIGHFGMLEGEDDPDIFRALFEAAEGWLRAKGMDRVIGPFSLSINQETGLLIDGFDTPPAMLMGHNPRHYGGHVEAQGYSKARDLYAYYFDVKLGMPPIIHRLIKRTADKGKVTVRQLNMKRYRQDLADIIDIFNEAWSDNWGYVPLTEAEAKKDIDDMKLIIRENIVNIAEIDGEPVGMMVTLPNFNEAAIDMNGRLFPFGWAKFLWRLKIKVPKSGRVVMMGVRKKYQGTSLGAGIAFMVIEACRSNAERAGMTWGELSWVLEDNIAMIKIAEAINSSVYKTYRVYSKSLAQT